MCVCVGGGGGGKKLLYTNSDLALYPDSPHTKQLEPQNETGKMHHLLVVVSYSCMALFHPVSNSCLKLASATNWAPGSNKETDMTSESKGTSLNYSL